MNNYKSQLGGSSALVATKDSETEKEIPASMKKLESNLSKRVEPCELAKPGGAEPIATTLDILRLLELYKNVC